MWLVVGNCFWVGTALIGRLVGLLALTISPEREVDFSMSSFVFIGAVAGLAGATRMTMSVVMIAAETSSVRREKKTKKTDRSNSPITVASTDGTSFWGLRGAETRLFH